MKGIINKAIFSILLAVLAIGLFKIAPVKADEASTIDLANGDDQEVVLQYNLYPSNSLYTELTFLHWELSKNDGSLMESGDASPTGSVVLTTFDETPLQLYRVSQYGYECHIRPVTLEMDGLALRL
ncbi:MAG: hypothetical protein II931_01365, partial [Clostridia bacterium]|nr:hypothetical protein [Clostridia bacterium]